MTNLTNGNPPGVVIPLEWTDMFTSLPRHEAGEVLLAILTYAATGALPEFSNHALDIVWPLFQSRLDSDRERYRKKVERSQAAAARREQERRQQAYRPQEQRQPERTEKSDRRPPSPSGYTLCRTPSIEAQAAALDKWL